MLHENVIANGIHEGAEAFGLAQSTVLAQDREYPRECFLAHVFDCMQGLESRPKLYLEQFRKVSNEMLLRLGVTCAKSCNVTSVE
jgi:hypothetical protein